MNVWITLAYQLIRRALKNDALWAYVEQLVKAADATADTGSARRAWVDRWLANDAVPEGVRAALATTATWLLNLAIEAMVARLRASARDQ